MKYMLPAILLTIPLILSPGCQSSSSSTPHTKTLTIGHSTHNSPILTHILGHGPTSILIIASIHGNEPAGTPLTQRLITHLKQNPKLLKNNRVIILPIANPDGYKSNTRHNANRVDLNRNFPTTNRRPLRTAGKSSLSEPESRALYRLINLFPPARVLSIHQPLNCVDYDGPARPLAQKIAHATNLPLKKLGARPGSLGSFLGVDKSIPTITLELPPNAHHLPPQTLWKKYHLALLLTINPHLSSS